ncbi:hypothetical protein [Halomonas sp. JS92-SW72]|uniref:hypothetical protein n=1 Tax=Halomonas sp. JS92-SW72 TaxID=2306583 RepID=UPI000E5C1D68|nr:hypothetical protein [Halomonas sp. JS92-SW72]AXY41986.1 hypothetical protein D1793_07075 [Halomonas sp. JS92-SW72]
MDTRESKTPEEELEHLKEVLEPEDFDDPEPDAKQPEAKQPPPRTMQRLLPIIIVVLGLLVAAMLIYSGSAQ